MTSSTPPRTTAGPSSSSEASSSARSPNRPVGNATFRLHPPRSLPPWIATYDEKYGSASEEQLRLLNPPAPSARPQHNATPQEPQRRMSRDGFVAWDDPQLGPPQPVRGTIPHFIKFGRASKHGRKWDHLRSAEPVIVSAYSSAYSSATKRPAMAWNEFLQASAWGHMPNEKSEIVDPEVLNRLQPTFNQPVQLPLHATDDRRWPGRPPRPRSAIYKRAWNRIMRSSLSPLLFRLVVMVTSILALGISIRIFELEDAVSQDSAERTQSVVAVVVDCVAIPFIAYTIWDEYTGKPLGLRSAVSKMSLILLDLIFIIFKSASTALAFESLVYHTLGGQTIRELSKTLAAVMLLGLLAWTMNLTVNIFRVVERLGGGEDDGA